MTTPSELRARMTPAQRTWWDTRISALMALSGVNDRDRVERIELEMIEAGL